VFKQKPEEMRCGSHYTSCMKLAAYLLFALMIIASATAAAAAEQCRFIEARSEREACYKRQDAERAARQKTDETKQAQPKPYEPMSQEDALLAKSMRGICRGC
jgi:hypothetical protein